MSIEIQHTARARVTAVGTREQFTANVAAITAGHTALQAQMGQMVAYAFVAYHRDGDKWPIDHIRAEVRLSKKAAERLSRALTAITKASVPEGTAPSKAALEFANEFVCKFFGEESARLKAQREKARAKREQDAKEAKAKADADLKQARAEGKAEAESDEELELPEFCLLGENGHITPLTPEEYTYLALQLSELRESSGEDRSKVVNLVADGDATQEQDAA